MTEEFELNCTGPEWEWASSFIDAELSEIPLPELHLPCPQLCNIDDVFPASGAAHHLGQEHVLTPETTIINWTGSDLGDFLSFIEGIVADMPLPPLHRPPPQLCNRDDVFPASGAAPPMMEQIYAPVVFHELPAAVPQIVQEIPVVRIPEGLEESMQLFGMVDGQPVYYLPQVFTPHVAAPTSPMKSPKRKSNRGPYAKKSPNAFMLFLREQRRFIDPAIMRLGSTAVNRVLGERWRSLSGEGRSKYYQQSDVEKQLHQQLNSKCTCSEEQQCCEEESQQEE